MADATRRMIDEEQQHIADEAHRRAARMVAGHRPLLEAFAASLLESEVLERGDIERITAEYEGEAVPRRRLEPLPGTGSGPRDGGRQPSGSQAGARQRRSAPE